ncbi:MAG: M16 family metallopeptidase [Flavobacteriales bacterium]
MKKFLLTLSVVLFTTFGLLAQTQLHDVTKQSEYDIPYEVWQLDNGLTILIHEDNSDPMVHVEVTYHVGSNREQIGMTGFAHFFEHMMFQGSEHVGDDEHFKIISESGGTMNGTTNRDRTNYYQTIPSNQLETALWLEADRMGYLLNAVTQEKFENQRDAVKNEKMQNQVNVPYGMLWEVKDQTLYPKGHPYSWPTIGYVDDLDRVTVNELKDFFLRWYGPNNAYLVVSGDINSEDVLALSKKYFGSIPKGQEVRNLRVPRVILPQNKYRKFADRIYFPMAAFVYPTVGNYHKDEAPLDALANMMGGGNNSQFYKEFVKTEKAVQAVVMHPCSELTGEFMIQVISYPEFTFAETETKINEIINNFDQFITQEALDRFKSKMRSDIIDGLSSVQGKASQLTMWAYLLDIKNNEPYNFGKEIERYESVTLEDVKRVYNKYIKNKKSVGIDYFPLPFGSEDSVKSINPFSHVPFKKDAQYEGLVYNRPVDSFDRSIRPTAGEAKSVKVPVYYESNVNLNAMEGGTSIPVIGAENEEVPKVNFLITLEGGDLLIDDVKKAGLSDLTAMLLNEGTKNYSTEEISSKLDGLGSSISFSSSERTSSIFVSSLVSNVDETIEILREKLFNPAFSEEDFERNKKQLKESINNNKKSARNMASEAMASILYGKTIRGMMPTVKGIEKLKLSEVKSFYKKQYNSALASVVVVGDMTKEQVMPKLKFLNQWEGEEIEINKNIPLSSIQGKTIYLVHKPGPQSIITLAHKGLKYDAYGDYYKAYVMNFLFGGTFSSRLNLNLREDKGYTYGIRSAFDGNDTDGIFYINTSVRSEATDSALSEIYSELESYIANGINEEELAFTQNSISNSDALRYETAFQKTRFLARIQRYGLDRNYISKQKDILKSLSTNDIKTLANKYLDAENHVVVVVGNKYALKDKLEKFGKVVELKIK